MSLFLTITTGNSNDSVNEMVENKKGDELLRDKFIDAYKPFIIKEVSIVIKKYVEIENSEEYMDFRHLMKLLTVIMSLKI